MKLKLLYTDWLFQNGKRYPLPNGNNKFLNDLAKQRAQSIELSFNNKSQLMDLLSYDGVKFSQIHDYFYKVWLEFYGTDTMVTLDEVDVDDQETMYLYVIELNYSNDNFTPRILFDADGKKVVYNLLEDIPLKIYQLVRQNKVKLIFSCIDNKCFEGHLQSLDIRLRLQGIPLDNVIMLSGNINLEYTGKLVQKEVMCAIRDIAIVMDGYPERGSLGYHSDYARIEDIDKDKFRNKKFLSWNRTMNRSHRYALLYFCQKYDLLKSGYFSFLSSHGGCETCLEYFYDLPFNELLEVCKDVENAIPIQIDTFDLNDQGRQSFRTIDNNKKEIYLDSYVHIVSETEFRNERTPYITEKSFRPIMNLQPFIMLNNAGALAKLKELGFKTFHPFIDESYDNEKDSKVRWQAVTSEILRINSMPIEEIHSWYHSIMEILLHNQKHLLSFVPSNILKDLIREFKNEN